MVTLDDVGLRVLKAELQNKYTMLLHALSQDIKHGYAELLKARVFATDTENAIVVRKGRIVKLPTLKQGGANASIKLQQELLIEHIAECVDLMNEKHTNFSVLNNIPILPTEFNVLSDELHDKLSVLMQEYDSDLDEKELLTISLYAAKNETSTNSITLQQKIQTLSDNMEYKKFDIEALSMQIKFLQQEKNKIVLNIENSPPNLLFSSLITRQVVMDVHDLNVILIGSYGCAKTSLAHRYIYNKFSENVLSTATFGCYVKQVKTGNENVLLRLFDTSGCYNFVSSLPMYIRNAKIIMAVFDLTVPNDLLNIIQRITNLKKYICEDSIIVLVGSKSDLIAQGKVNKEEIKKVTESYALPYFSCSAKTGEGVREIFQYIIDQELQPSCDIAHANIVNDVTDNCVVTDEVETVNSCRII